MMGSYALCRHALRLPTSRRAIACIHHRVTGTAGCLSPGMASPETGRHPPPIRRRTAVTATKQYGAVRPVPITVVTVTSNQKKDPAVVYANEWLDKLARYVNVEQVTLRPNPTGVKDPELAKAEESKRVLAMLQKSKSPSVYTVCLDERGKDATSESLADMLELVSASGCTSVHFLIGGPFGWTDEVRRASNETIRLSRCVLNHAVAKVVLCEQLYRAWSILKGEPYHH